MTKSCSVLTKATCPGECPGETLQLNVAHMQFLSIGQIVIDWWGGPSNIGTPSFAPAAPLNRTQASPVGANRHEHSVFCPSFLSDHRRGRCGRAPARHAIFEGCVACRLEERRRPRQHLQWQLPRALAPEQQLVHLEMVTGRERITTSSVLGACRRSRRSAGWCTSRRTRGAQRRRPAGPVAFF